MTVLGRYLDAAGQSEAFQSEPGRPGSSFDEFAAPDGTVRRGWVPLMGGLDEFAETDLVHAQREVARLLADDGVTYTPNPMATITIADAAHSGTAATQRREQPDLASPRPWLLDPLPLVIDEGEWAHLEAGIVQRTELLDAIMADLYGSQRLLAEGRIPPAAIFDHEEYLRPVVGIDPQQRQHLFLAALDLGRDTDGRWRAISDRTQAPSGAGYAMQNRRVVSRVLPEVYHQANLHRLTPFFQTMRMALIDAAPKQVEDPRVVVLSPGTRSETAFDQAFLASLLGFPLLEGSDLTVRDGRVWMRVLGKLEQVDVILRRVDSYWTDALELRPGSRLGVTGLLNCVRQGTVSVVNAIGSGILENPALMPRLPELCELLLDEPLRLPSVDTWWCGEPSSLSHVLANLDDIVIRPISRGHGRSAVGAALTRAQRERLVDAVRAAPHRYVGQRLLRLSSAPTSEQDRLVRRTVVMRGFAVRSGDSYAAMLGGLAKVSDETRRAGALVTGPDPGLAKDVWVVSSTPIAETRAHPRRLRSAGELGRLHPAAPSAAMVPRVLADLYWFGRYAERAEDLLRLLLASRTVAIETDLDTTQGRALEVLLRAVTHVSTSYPGFLAPGVAMLPEFRALLLDRHRLGSVAQALGSLSMAAQGVRDQLSEDIWMVLADVERAQAALAANPYDQGLQFTDACERVLSGLLALAGIVSENMVRDPGWYLLDIGRGLERSLQVLALLRVTVGRARLDAETDRLVIEAVLAAAESIVTFRRRYRGQTGVDALIELLVIDEANPRSVGYQLLRIQADLQSIPHSSPSTRPLRQVDTLLDRVRGADLSELVFDREGSPIELDGFLADLQDQLRGLSDAVREAYQQPPAPQQPLWQSWSPSPGEGVA